MITKVSVLIAALVVMWAHATMELADQHNSYSCDLKLTPEMFEQMEPGMTLDGVISIIGAEPSEILSGKIQETTSVLKCSWETCRRSAIRSIFVNGRLTYRERTDYLD